MDCSLEDIFNQIAESEMKAESRKRHLTEVRQKINDCTIKRKAVTLEYQACLKQLNTKTEELIDSRLVEKSLALRLSILQEQKDQLGAKKASLSSQLEKLCETLEADTEKFSNRVREFTSGYGFGGSGLNQRTLAAREEIKRLIESQQQIQSEMGKIYEQNKHRAVGDKQYSEQKRNQLQDLKKQHKELIEQLEKMELEKSRISEFPQVDPELKKLQDEVEVSQDVTLESRCGALRLQLQQLQQQHWKHLQHIVKPKSSQKQHQQPKQKMMPQENKVSVPKIEK